MSQEHHLSLGVQVSIQFVLLSCIQYSGQIIATSHDLDPQKVAKEGKSRYFRQIPLVKYDSIWGQIIVFCSVDSLIDLFGL